VLSKQRESFGKRADHLGWPAANIEAFRDWVGKLPEVLGVFAVSGEDDSLIHVAVPQTDSLYAFVIDRLTERPEIADVRTSVVYEHLRRWVIEPL
jgi:DNA-binding Lrp family transcriptional regulator